MQDNNYYEEDILNFRQLFFLDKFLIGHKGFIAGGCFKNIFNNERINDIDIFFRNKGDYAEAVKYFQAEVKNHPSLWKLSYQNSKVYAVYSKKDNVRLELIKSTFGEPLDIIKNFDFTVTKFVYFSDGDRVDPDDYMAQFAVIYHTHFFEHLQTKRLVLDADIPFPISTFERSYKYQAKGYGLCRESKAKLLQAINELPDVSEEELNKSLYMGVD